MRYTTLKYFFLLATLIGPIFSAPAHALESALELREIYSSTVDRKLNPPAEEQRYYAELLLYHLQKAGLSKLPAQYMLLVDRSPNVQAIFLFWLGADGQAELIGASPASTGKENGYEYFETPTGIFEHNPRNMDFRAEGTKNEHGLRGYGDKGMRIYDFGWVKARKSWVDEIGDMRLQLHSTDLLKLEQKLGVALSKGCIRIPASLNKLLDHYGILDADYELAANNNKVRKILDPSREATAWPGKYLIIIDSRRVQRPDWSPLPALKKTPVTIPKPEQKTADTF